MGPEFIDQVMNINKYQVQIFKFFFSLKMNKKRQKSLKVNYKVLINLTACLAKLIT